VTQLGIGVRGYVVAGDGERDEDGGVVEGIFKGCGELLLDGLGGELYVGTDGTKVGEDAEDALGLLGRRLCGLGLSLRCVDVGWGCGLIGVRAAGGVGRDAEVESCGGRLEGSGRGGSVREGGLLRVQGCAEAEDGESERKSKF